MSKALFSTLLFLFSGQLLAVPVYWEINYYSEGEHEGYGYFSYDDATTRTVIFSTPLFIDDVEDRLEVNRYIDSLETWDASTGQEREFVRNQRIWWADADNGISSPGGVGVNFYGSSVPGGWYTNPHRYIPYQQPYMNFDEVGDYVATGTWGEEGYTTFNHSASEGYKHLTGNFIAVYKGSVLPAVPVGPTLPLFLLGLVSLAVFRKLTP